MLSKKATYALHALMALAEEPKAGALMIGEIAERKRLPKKFLEQILLDLKHHGLVASRRGIHGGYSLLRRPDEIRIGDVLRIIDGPQAPLPCLSTMAYRRCEECRDEQACRLRGLMARVHDATSRALDTLTLADAYSRLTEPSAEPPAEAQSA